MVYRVLGAKARPGRTETTTVPPCRVAVPPTVMRSLWPWPTTSTRYVPLAAFTKLPATLIVPRELAGATVPVLKKLPPTVPLPDRTPRFRKLPLTAPLLTNEPPLVTDPAMVPVFVAVPTLRFTKSPLTAPLLTNEPPLMTD